MNRSFHIIGMVNRYDNWHISLVANGIDEIVFDVHKYADGKLCPIWDDLVDLKVMDVDGFGRFEITVDYTDGTETVKSVHGFSLETELAQVGLYDFHVNDEEAADMEITEYSKGNYDSDGNFIPTTFYREIFDTDTPEEAEFKRRHSLLHRVLADKAPHWGIGYITPWIALGEDAQPEESSRFQRTYTVDGDSIYDFLTGTVSEESNVVFTFDTINRLVNCYSLCDCIDQETGEVLCRGIGDDTFVFVSKAKLANETAISSNKDNLKNCFRIEGGDDVITDMVRAVNMNGSNYIYQFADFQYNDMSGALRDKIKAYQAMMSSQGTQDEYYGNGGIINSFLGGSLTLQIGSKLDAFHVLSICNGNKIKTDGVDANVDTWASCYVAALPDGTKELRVGSISYQWASVGDAIGGMGVYARLCHAYDILAYLESSMMPGTPGLTEVGTAQEQYEELASTLSAPDSYVAVSSVNDYNDNLFVGVTNNIEAYARVLVDPRFDLEVADGTASYDSSTNTWTGKICIRQHTDAKNVYPADILSVPPINVKVNDDRLGFARQKIEKALHKGSMLDIDFDVAGMGEGDMREYFSQYSLNRLKSFYDGYNSCISILSTLGHTATSDVQEDIYGTYHTRMEIVLEALSERQSQVDNVNRLIRNTQEEQHIFQSGGTYDGKHYEPHDFKAYLGDEALYKELCSYRREDTYTNSNYISDGLSTAGCLEKAKELVQAAEKEARKACVLQRTVSASLNNLFALPELERLWDSFALYNYIRVETEDEILKLRLIGIEFMGDSPEKIEVTFSEQIESIDGVMSDLHSVFKQAKSMATSYPSTTLQAKQGSDAKGEISDMYANGLNAAKTMLTNNDNNEVTITQSGILCKRMDDEGHYGDKQMRITGNIMALTDDGWKTVKMAVGESVFYNPFTQKYELKYGIQASVIVGELLCGNNMFIGNEDGNVKITGDGIEISNGVIKSSDYAPNKSGSIIDLRNGSFSFGNGSLTYDGDNKLQVIGDIQATSIFAEGKYDLRVGNEQIPVLYGTCDKTQTFAPVWSLKLQVNDRSYINLKNSSSSGDLEKTEMDIKADNIHLLGNTYSQTGEIITSDRNAKDNITSLTDNHIKFFSLLQPVSFTFTDGESGRTHIGFISQDVENAMSQAGFTDLDFAGFCKAVKTKEFIDSEGNKTREIEKDENGNPIYVYALRYEEFIALNTFMIQNLNKKVQSLQEENQDIKERLMRLEEKLDILK